MNFLAAEMLTVSVLMECRNAGSFVKRAVDSALSQPECLELLVVVADLNDGSMHTLEALAAIDPRLRLIIPTDHGLAYSLNKALCEARGTCIAWLNDNDLLTTGALSRAVNALNTHPEWLMVYGDGEVCNQGNGMVKRYSSLPVKQGLNGFRSHSLIDKSTVLFRRTMSILLGKVDNQWEVCLDSDYWIKAFKAFPHRIGYLPHIQSRKYLLSENTTAKQSAELALETTRLLAHHFCIANAQHLSNYALELHHGIVKLPEGEDLVIHLQQLFDSARPYLAPDDFFHLQRCWITTDLLKSPQSQICSLRLERPQLAVSKCSVPFEQRPFGVNLIGHAFETFGVGEDIRMAVRALQTVNVPCCVIHHPAANGSSCDDRTLEQLICSDPEGGPYLFNLVCMTAPIQARWLCQNGLGYLSERYTISSWPWETQEWPKAWLPFLDFADELWPSSHFTATGLSAPAAGACKPLHVMPMSAEITNPDRFCNATARTAIRQRYGLSTKSVLFCCSFDFNSTIIRKNPIGALEAFQRAFPLPNLPSSFGRECKSHPLAEQVCLLIKTFPPSGFSPEWEWLQARAKEDTRIVLIAENLERDELLALFASCDVFLSLHRSEGYGRCLAEALQLGVDIIATDFGGNTDFCVGPLSHPVRWIKVPVPLGSYPNADGHCWAEPDLEHAAELCQKIALKRIESAQDRCIFNPSDRSEFAIEYRKMFSFKAIGSKYLDRLNTLWGDRDSLSTYARWREKA